VRKTLLAYRRVIAEEAEVLRAAQLARIEEATLATWPRVLNGEDRAVQSLCRLLERRAKLTEVDIEAPGEPERRM
jgi:hypothetical protein